MWTLQVDLGSWKTLSNDDEHRLYRASKKGAVNIAKLIASWGKHLLKNSKGGNSSSLFSPNFRGPQSTKKLHTWNKDVRPSYFQRKFKFYGSFQLPRINWDHSKQFMYIRGHSYEVYLVQFWHRFDRGLNLERIAFFFMVSFSSSTEEIEHLIGDVWNYWKGEQGSSCHGGWRGACWAPQRSGEREELAEDKQTSKAMWIYLSGGGWETIYWIRTVNRKQFCDVSKLHYRYFSKFPL